VRATWTEPMRTLPGRIGSYRCNPTVEKVMVAEKELVVKEYRDKLWASGLSHIQIDAIVEVVFDEADNTFDRIGGKVEELGEKLRPAIAEMIESEVSLRMGRLEQRIDKIRRDMPLPESKFFGSAPAVKPRRRLGRYVLFGIGAMILGPIALSLMASGMKALLGSLLHLLS